MAGKKQQDFDIVVASDNNDYLAWQCFNKKNYMNEDALLSADWKSCAPEGTVNGAVTRAIHEAAVFYDLA